MLAFQANHPGSNPGDRIFLMRMVPAARLPVVMLSGDCIAIQRRTIIPSAHDSGMKPRLKQAAMAKISYILDKALNESSTNPKLARRYAALAWRMNTRHRLRIPCHMRILFCRRCKSFIPPGAGARVRLGGGRPRCIRTTCLYCGYVHRRLI